ncbi:uncharacterized protein JCM10292_005843 [Rhodotorula paludigena]|uniref:uncharacterized protein n=1 Tax=Rhodotorula paludigena TaxID=86838 RepID=UPI003174F028
MASIDPHAPPLPHFPYADLLDHGPYGDFRDALKKDGYVVVKGAIPRERALEYRDRLHGWLESFGRGYDRNDPSTFSQAHLPVYSRGGMYNSYGIGQEQAVWDIRLEPGVRKAFETIWGTDKLVSSMDSATIMLPGQPPLPPSLRQWKHVDLSPWRTANDAANFFVAQGLVNLNDNGPDDGGLLVMKGSSELLKQYFEETGRPKYEGGKYDWHTFEEEEMDWFFERGCEWLKVCAEPGDLILWSSHTIHQNCPPRGTRDRVVTYVCQGPAELMTEEDKAVRKRAFEEGYSTSHAPFHGTWLVDRQPIREETGKVDPDYRTHKNPVEKTDAVRRLAGVLPY